MSAAQLAFNRVKEAFDINSNPDISMRRHWLLQLQSALKQHEHDLIIAMGKDFSSRSEMESRMADLMPCYTLLRYTLKNLSHWMKPEKRPVDLVFRPGKAWVEYQPIGVVGIIAPWNYPVNLALLPLITALAAGNRVLLKLSEYTPETNRVLSKLLSDVFSHEEVGVIQGGTSVGEEFSRLPFNHIIFTGSSAVGRKVMRAAAENLTPVTLELGGKSPVLVAPDSDVTQLAGSIVFGKSLNAGQTCIAPDYLMCTAAQCEPLVVAMQKVFTQQYPTALDNEAYTSIINEQHFQRLIHLLADAKKLGATIIPLQQPAIDEARRRIVPHIITGVTDNMLIMQEEIFGPLLPIKIYDVIGSALRYIHLKPKPLALYLMTSEPFIIEMCTKQVHSGGLCINETMLHAAVDSLPFGGIGTSGVGCYHGPEGFKRLSHSKAVLQYKRVNFNSLIHPPYRWWHRLAVRWLSRK
ncbi:MAG: coniferyl aldehyde dehydrogenase [Plesiomonas sp.]|uniref:coniferyl aldehyde dehydrogenase n=1 Tax=Plesiomonas sp. TaxID=2486279 RepID=UPI003F3FFEFA